MTIFGIQVAIPGKKAMIIVTMKKPKRYGRHSFASFMIGIPLNVVTAKMHIPTGGVRLPIMISSVMTIPKFTRSRPYILAIGRNNV